MRRGALWSYLLLAVIGGAFIPNSVFNNLTFPLLTDFHNTFAASPIDSLHPNNPQLNDRNSATAFSEVTQVSPPDPEPTIEQEGTIDARHVTQSATYTSDWQSLRTDANKNASLDLLLDQSHNWIGQKVEMQINNLQDLYLQNATFNDGINGTNVDGIGNAHPVGWTEQVYDGGNSAQTQRTSYVNSSGYVIVENEGENMGGRFQHVMESYVRWNQTVTANLFTDQFYLRFNYLYKHGPLGGANYKDRIYLVVWFDSTIVYQRDVTSLDGRDQWFDTGLLGIEGTVSTTFNFVIGLYIVFSTNLDPSNPACNGVANARFITLLFDDISLVAVNPPYPSEVALRAYLPDTTPVNITDTGRGSGIGTVVHEYWEIDPITLTFSANTSTSFDCYVTLHVLNLKNSTSKMNTDAEGVKYEVAAGQLVNLTLWIVVAYPASYQKFQFNVTFPSDWTNVTVYDSFPSDVTAQCIIGSGYIQVNESIAGQLGWWQIQLQSPNYAKSLATEVFNTTTGLWQSQSTFRSTNKTRVVGSIGNNNSIPNPVVGINTTWLLPNQSLWSQAIASGETDGRFNSSSWWLGGINTSAGIWTVLLSWKNDSEIAFDAVVFILYHKARLTPVYDTIDTNPETPLVTGMVFYVDDDNSAFLLDEVASVVANWSSTIINFAPNSVQNRWEGDFDMSIVDLGSHIIRVNATHPYFDDTYCNFTITVSGVKTHLKVLVSPPSPAYLKQSVEIKVRYEDSEGAGILEAAVNVDSTDPYGGIVWDPGTPVSGEPGNYTIVITPLVDEEIRVILNATKKYYLPATNWFFLSVPGLAAELKVVQGNSSVYVPVYDPYVVTLRYTNTTHGLPNASVTFTITPETGLDYSVVQDMNDGNYSISLTPTQIKSFTIVFEAKLTNYTLGIAYLSLASVPISTSLSVSEPPSQIGIGGSVILTLQYYCSYGVAGVNIEVRGLSSTEVESIDHGNGDYTVVLTPKALGDYFIQIRLSRLGYEERAWNFSFKVIIPPPTPLQLVAVFIGVLLAFVSGYISRRQLKKRRAASQAKMLAARQEFEDARNIVATLVIYKHSGLPAFSTTTRKDMQGELVSGFISAVRHFRREVITREQDELFELVPISDVAYICPTRSMLCVLITLMPPSQRLLEKLVELSQIIDREYDDLLLEREGSSIEQIIPQTLAEVVEKVFSLQLLARHVNAFDHSVPRKFRDLERACSTLFPIGNNINLIELARYLQRQGKREKFAYYIIQKAVQAGYLVSLPRSQSPERNPELITLLDSSDETDLENNMELEGSTSTDTQET